MNSKHSQRNNDPYENLPLKRVCSDQPHEDYPLSADPSKDVAIKKPGRKRAEWRRVWYDFSQSTTLHGVHNVTDDTPFPLRRLIWVLIVTLGIVLFVFQVTNSVVTYLQYPVTVNVKINYNTTLQFPAVSICNQNDFRMTATSEEEIYHLVVEYYSRLGSGILTDMAAYNRTNITLDTFYYKTAHDIHDMVMSCTWDEQACSINDFVTQLTDYGVCFTFNSGIDGGQIRYVSQTGADRGLRLRLNIEQYEYMVGPNPGAGIKLLVHENNEVPLVRDLGVAIPPGTHAFVGVQIFEVNNLPAPHGECNESVALSYHDTYSLAACVIECKETYLLEECGCRDVYMPPSPSDLDYPPICTLEQYQGCAGPAMTMFNNGTYRCDCPVPCKRSMYDTSISYAYTSQFDSEIFINEENITALSMSFIKARETSQRVLDFVIMRDRSYVTQLHSTMIAMDATLNRTRHNLRASEDILTEVMSNLGKRTTFHLTWGLEKVLYMANYNFARGYEVYNERTLSLVTYGYQEMVAYLENVLQRANELPPTEEMMRTALYISALKETHHVEVLCTRALANLTTIDDSFSLPTKLNTYIVTPYRHYDDYLVTPELVIYSSIYWEKSYMSKFILRTQQFQEANRKLAEHVENILLGEMTDMEQFETDRQDFEKAARSYNYYNNIYQERIVSAPTTYAQERIDIFNDLVGLNIQAYIALASNVKSTLNFLDEAAIAWEYIRHVKDAYDAYVNGVDLNKTQLAAMFTSNTFVAQIGTLEQFFSEISTRSIDAVTKLRHFIISYNDLWVNMVPESTLIPYYQAIHNDVMNQSSQANEDILKVYAKFLDQTENWTVAHWDELDVYLNADFAGITNVSLTLEEFAESLKPVEVYVDVTDVIGHLDETFFSIVTTLKNNMQSFLNGHEVGDKFYKDNIMNVDVFMRELSYEVVEQQEAYSLPSLWSDIGGSMGLFIGASVITVFELVDVVIHNIFRLHCCAR